MSKAKKTPLMRNKLWSWIILFIMSIAGFHSNQLIANPINKGKELFNQRCAACHKIGGGRLGRYPGMSQKIRGISPTIIANDIQLVTDTLDDRPQKEDLLALKTVLLEQTCDFRDIPKKKTP